MRLDHIGIAVRQLEDAVRPYTDGLGLQLERVEEVAAESVRVAFLTVGESHIELLEPLGGQSPIAGFLEKRGEGVHHLAVAVPDIRLAMDRAKRAGLRLLSEEPRPGAGGSRVCFVHPKDFGGVLVELVEHPHRSEE